MTLSMPPSSKSELRGLTDRTAQGGAPSAGAHLQGALWLVWASLLTGALWVRSATTIPECSLGIALALTAAIAATALVAAVLLRRTTVWRLCQGMLAVLAGTALLSGERRSWLAAATILLLALGPGLLLTRLCARAPAPPFVALGLGLTVLSLVGLMTSLRKAFPFWPFVLTSAASWVAYLGSRPVGQRRRRQEGQDRRPQPYTLSVAGGLTALLVILMLQASVPDCCFDPVWAHLPLAQAIAEERHAAIPAIWWTMTPHAYHVLAAMAYRLGDVMAAKFLHFLFLLLNAGWAVWFGAKLYGLSAGLGAAALFLTIPLVMWDGTVGNTDMGATFFVASGITAVFEFLRRGGMGWLLAAGSLLGTATAIKYAAPAVFVPLALVLLIEAARRRTLRRLVPGCLFLLLGFMVTAGPWLARTAVLTGNPVFPAFNDAFASPYWPTAWPAGTPVQRFPWTVTQTLRIPWLLTFDSARLGEVPQGAMGTFPLLWLPLLATRWSEIPREGRYLLLIAAGHFVSVFSFTQNPRYQLLTWLLVATVLGGVVGTNRPPGGRKGGAAGILTVAIVLAGLAYSFVSWQSFFPARASFDYLSGRIDREQFLQRTVPAMEMFPYLQNLVPRDGKILTHGVYTTWFAGRYLVPSFLPPVRALFTTPDLSRKQAVGILREYGLRYLLVPSQQQLRLLDLGIATPLLRHAGFTLYEFTLP